MDTWLCNIVDSMKEDQRKFLVSGHCTLMKHNCEYCILIFANRSPKIVLNFCVIFVLFFEDYLFVPGFSSFSFPVVPPVHVNNRSSVQVACVSSSPISSARL